MQVDDQIENNSITIETVNNQSIDNNKKKSPLGLLLLGHVLFILSLLFYIPCIYFLIGAFIVPEFSAGSLLFFFITLLIMLALLIPALLIYPKEYKRKLHWVFIILGIGVILFWIIQIISIRSKP